MQKKLRVAFYSPFGLLREWRLQELHMARACAQLGHSVEVLECNGFQGFCLAISTNEKYAKRKESISSICKRCNQYKNKFFDARELNKFSLDTLLQEKDFEYARNVSRRGKDLPINFHFQGLAIGKITRTHLCIKNQEFDLEKMPLVDESEYKKEIEACILMQIAATKLFAQKQYDFLFCQNGMYPTTRILSEIAEKNGTKVIALNNSILKHKFFRTTRFANKNYYNQLEINLNKWRKLRRRSRLPIKLASESLDYISKGKYFINFSAPKGNLDDFRLHMQKNKKIVLMTMSSEDELRVAQLLGYKQRKKYKNIYENQYKWLTGVLNYAKRRQDYFFVIRPHPRDWPNARTKRTVISPSGQRIIGILKNQTLPNLYIDTPDKRNSIYSLIEHANIIINSWSNIGEEATCLGKPVITTFPKYCNYPPELTLVARSKKEYFALLSKKQNNKRLKNMSKTMKRWIGFNALSCEVDTPNFNEKLKEFDKPKNKIKKFIKKIFPFQVYLQLSNLKELLPEITDETSGKILKVLQKKLPFNPTNILKEKNQN